MATPVAAAGLSAPTFVFAPGKTWFMPVTYLQRNADGSIGAPVNLTGGVVSGMLFTRANPVGIPLTVANGGVTVDAVNGLMNFILAETVTAGFAADNIQPFADCYNYPTRLEVDFRDSLGHLSVVAVFPIFVFSPQFVDPSTFPTQQAGTIVSGGPQGVSGPAGLSASSILTKTAIGGIAGHAVVKAVVGGVSLASSDSIADAGLVVGVSLGAAPDQGSLQIQSLGEVTEQSWSWSPGAPLFLGLSGALTQTPPLQGLLQQIGVAMTSTTLLVDIQDSTVRP